MVSIKIKETSNTPTARIVSPDLKTKANLLLDSGSEINIIKKPALPESAIINEQEIIEVVPRLGRKQAENIIGNSS